MLTGLWFHKAGRVYYKYNVVCATWTVALLAIPYRHAPRYQASTAERPKRSKTKYLIKYGSFYSVHGRRGDGPATPRGHGADSGVTLSRLRA